MRPARRSLAVALTVLAMTAALPALALDAHQAEGWFSVDGERVEVTSAYGWQEPHLFDRTKMETIVLLATIPFDHAALDRYQSFGFEPTRMLRSAGGEALKLTIDPDGLKLVPKGKRKGLDLRWTELTSGDAALATALQASLRD